MARRGKSKSGIGTILLLLGVLVVGGLVVFLMKSRSSDPFADLTNLNVSAYVENANSLGSNVYKITGTIDQRLDDWRSEEGRLFSVEVQDGSGSADLPVFFSADFNGMNIQPGQEYRMRVSVGDGGLLIAQDFQKT